MTRILAAVLFVVLGGFALFGMYTAAQDVALGRMERDMRGWIEPRA